MRMTDAHSLRIGRHRQIGHEDRLFVICLLTYVWRHRVSGTTAPACTTGWRLVSLRLLGVRARQVVSRQLLWNKPKKSYFIAKYVKIPNFQ